VYQIVQAHEGRGVGALGGRQGHELRSAAAAHGAGRRWGNVTPASASAGAVLAAAAAEQEQKGARVVTFSSCDDERSICELLDIALRRDGHKVETVTGGEAAKQQDRQRASST